MPYTLLARSILAALLILLMVSCGGGGDDSAGGTGSNNVASSAASSGSGASSSFASAAASSASSLSSAASSTAVASSSTASVSSSSMSSASSSGAASSSLASSSSSLATSSTATPVSRTNGFYVDPNSQAKNWVNANPADSRMVTIRDGIANQASGKWFGEWSGDIGGAVATYVNAANTAGKLPMLIAYNIPNRDCGSYSAGGASGGDAYKTWIAAFASAIGSKPALVILEPDALMQLDCLPSDIDRAARLVLLNYAVDQFAAKATGAWLYIDAGHSNWKNADETATRLINAGVARARGFALNVSNYRASSELVTHGQAINTALQSKAGLTRPFVLDTSRNGNGPNGSLWCDPAGRKVGVPSQVHTLGVQQEMSLWLKAPGESDGCAGSAGTFVPDLAYRLVLGS